MSGDTLSTPYLSVLRLRAEPVGPDQHQHHHQHQHQHQRQQQQQQLALCRQHGTCYTLDALDKHLAKRHGMSRKSRTEALEGMRAAGLVSGVSPGDIERPVCGGPPIDGLPVAQGYRCRTASCRLISANKGVIRKHCRTQHGWSSGTGGRRTQQQQPGRQTSEPTGSTRQPASLPYEPVQVQTLWTEKKHIDYFVVCEPAAAEEEGGEEDGEANVILSKARYDAAQQRQQEKQGLVVEAGEHVSESTPWLRRTGFDSYLFGLPLGEIADAYCLPDRNTEPELAAICESAQRVLFKGMALLQAPEDRGGRQLSRLQAKLLNTFRRAEMTQDPIILLQNRQSKANYALVWKKLVCYFARAAGNHGLLAREGRPPFEQTQQQEDSFARLVEQAGELLAIRKRQTDSGSGSSDSGEEEESQQEVRAKTRLDREALHFGFSLIAHRLEKRAFDSPMVSFAAVLAWDTTRHTWKDVNNYTSYLSQIIYDCQLLVLLHSLDLLDCGRVDNLTAAIVGVRDEWLLNDTAGPVAELLSIRLLGFEIGKNTVNQAQVRWHEDGETIVYKDIQLQTSQLQDLVLHEVQAAAAILRRDLCFGLEDIPEYEVGKLVDNWDSSSPGQSFLTDPRNKDYILEGQSWLFQELQRSPDLLKLLGKSKGWSTRGGRRATDWQLSDTAVGAYEFSVQRFLEHMMVLLHVASGQPARRPEFLGIRWCNRQADKRNLFVHDGHLLFILTYYKGLNTSSSSRFPVRFLLPEVARLLVQFLVLVQPFRVWLSEETGSLDAVSEYLWHDRKGIWSEDRMTRVLESHSARAIGVPLTVQAWRQLAVGIAIKKFRGKGFQLDRDQNNSSSGAGMEQQQEEEGGGGFFGNFMPDALHWQASHNPRTGNAVYGGTVNFNRGLTDAGLQEYLHASRLWHSLCTHPYLLEGGNDGQTQAKSTGKHSRSESSKEAGIGLTKRLAIRKGEQGCQKVWTREQALTALKQMYGPGAVFKGQQEQAIQAIIGNKPQVVVVLPTGAGKSLVYQLPARLPGGGTTILVVPLVALKQETVEKCRQLGVDCSVWHPERPPSPGCPLVLVSLDQAVQPPFLGFANRLDITGMLARVVVDESHLVCTASSYRRRMAEVKKLRSLHCQFVLLTATLPPQLKAEFERALLLKAPLYIRSLTLRTDLEYYVHQIKEGGPGSAGFEGEALAYIKAGLAKEEESEARALVYVQTKAQADRLAAGLGCPVYYSDSGTEEEKAVTLQKWRDGKAKVLVSTSALAGVDYRHVRVVFHLGEPSGGVIDFAQDIGRAGRDGKGGISVVILPPNWRPSYNGSEGGQFLLEGAKAMQRFLDSPRCRKIPLGVYLDGKAQSCREETTACDRCYELGLVRDDDLLREAKEEEEGEGSSRRRVEEADSADLGSLLLRQHNSEQARQLDDFLEGLDILKSCCVLCWTASRQSDHVLEQCRSADRQRFIAAKQKALREGREQRGGWLAKYRACFGCGNIQIVCQGQGSRGCEYKDLLMPLCWAVLHRSGWARQVLQGFPRALAFSQDEGAYMLWLGEEATVFGEQGTNMAAVGQRVVQLLYPRGERIVK